VKENSAKNYSFGQKNNWRRWAWNQIRERLMRRFGSVKDAYGFYMPSGGEDLDRIEAERKGFDPRKLIAVNDDPEVIASVRRSGVIAVPGDVDDVLRAWNGPAVRFAVLDFCGGMSDKTTNAAYAAWQIPRREVGAALVVNLLRGREPKGQRFKQWRAELESAIPNAGGTLKHRGNAFCISVMRILVDAIVTITPDLNIEDRRIAIVDVLEPAINPSLFSYRSGVQIFDSVAMNMISIPMPSGREADEAVIRRVRAAQALLTRRAAN